MAMDKADNSRRKCSGRGRILAFGAAMLAGTLGLIYAGGGSALLAESPHPWAMGAVTSPLFLTCSIVLVVCAALSMVLVVALHRLAARRARPDAQEGGAVLEFILVLPILLMLGLIMTQSSLLMGGNLCVNYAAYCAARSAIVQIPANYSPSEPPNILGPDRQSSLKRRRIHLAAAYPILPMSANLSRLGEADDRGLIASIDSLYAQYGQQPPEWNGPVIRRKLQWALDKTSVEISEPEGDNLTYTENQDIKIKVTHTFYLSVPYAAWFFSLAPGGVDLGDGGYGMEMVATGVLTNEGQQDWIDIEHFPQTR